MDGSEGDLGGVLAGTVLYIVGKIGGREENREAKDTSTDRSRYRPANGV